MRKLVVLGLVGLIAQLIDGSLGMGYGATSSSLLLMAGITPALVSASVHLAEVGTNIASGTAHWRLGNVDWSIVRRLGVPGMIGALAGATFLSHLSTSWAAPIMAGVLTGLGIVILFKHTKRPLRATSSQAPQNTRMLVPLGIVGGFVDATGGGGWGPISTSTLLSTGKTAPRKVIGSVDTSEFLVSVAASVGFFVSLGASGIDLRIVAALLIGGVIAAPVAAWLVSKLPAPVLGVGAGGMIVLTNGRVLLSVLPISNLVATLILVAAAITWITLVAKAWRRYRNAEKATAAHAEELAASANTSSSSDDLLSVKS